MNNAELIQQWNKLRDQVIFAQLAPSALLITSVALLQFGLADARAWVKLACAGILLASGILGALAEYAAAKHSANAGRAGAAAKAHHRAIGELRFARHSSFDRRPFANR